MTAPIFLQQAEIARVAEQMAALCDGDDQLFANMIEGETDLNRIVLRLHEQIARDEEMICGIKERQASLMERRQRAESRLASRKATIGKFMRCAKLATLVLPEVTYSVREGKPSLKVVDPLAVPLDLCRTKAEPDKEAINEKFADETALPNWLVREPARDVVTARTK